MSATFDFSVADSDRTSIKFVVETTSSGWRENIAAKVLEKTSNAKLVQKVFDSPTTRKKVLYKKARLKKYSK